MEPMHGHPVVFPVPIRALARRLRQDGVWQQVVPTGQPLRQAAPQLRPPGLRVAARLGCPQQFPGGVLVKAVGKAVVQQRVAQRKAGRFAGLTGEIGRVLRRIAHIEIIEPGRPLPRRGAHDAAQPLDMLALHV